MWEEYKGWINRKSDIVKLKNGKWRCLKFICLKLRLVLENVVV